MLISKKKEDAMISVQRIKDGSTISTKSGMICTLVDNKQIVDGYDDHGAEYVEVKHIWRVLRLDDEHMFHLGANHKVLLLEGETKW
jgi:membrane protease subunit (stomatin/prohibitin family)